ncbi:MAG: sorbosone dehydrogenase family protein [Saprospiraceae bacterium]|nr:sorbosone dehydrogenase family protein [Saprospiraceae bacterium]
MKLYIFFLSTMSLIVACNAPVNMPEKPKDIDQSDLPIDRLILPEGFQIDIYADNINNARSMTLSPDGTLYVGTRGGSEVYALKDLDSDFKVDTVFTIYEDGEMPNGVAFKDGDLYVAEVSRILKFADIENNLTDTPAPEVVFDGYPSIRHHGWKYIAFGPDGHLYVPVGAPCNICESEDPVFNSITRLKTDGSGYDVVQSGVRNTVGFTWHPVSGELWFTDNGRDWMGDDMPACELNRASQDNMHFGYPYCHQGDTADPDFGDKRSCDEFTAPVQNLGAHVAPLGIEFYAAEMFPPEYHNNVAFIAEHGSWNRSKKSGYKLSMVRLDSTYNAIAYEDFVTGWLNENTDEAWGRPVDIEYLPDGSMLVSDDFANAIYRITYQP